MIHLQRLCSLKQYWFIGTRLKLTSATNTSVWNAQQALFLSKLYLNFGCPFCTDLKRKQRRDHIHQISFDTGEKGQGIWWECSETVDVWLRILEFEWKNGQGKLYHLKKLEGEKCRKDLKPKAQRSPAQIHNQCRWPGTWLVVKNVNPTFELFQKCVN